MEQLVRGQGSGTFPFSPFVRNLVPYLSRCAGAADAALQVGQPKTIAFLRAAYRADGPF